MDRWRQRNKVKSVKCVEGKKNNNSLIICEDIIGYIAAGGGLISICALMYGVRVYMGVYRRGCEV